MTRAADHAVKMSLGTGMADSAFSGDTLEVDRKVSIAAALFVFVMGSISFPLLPMVVGAVTDHLDFSTREVGLIASADMFGMFLVGAVWACCGRGVW